jgi:glutamine synthetase
MPDDSTFLANTGDMLAVPDPVSFAIVPYHSSTARVHAFLRQDDGSDWDGCPRTRLQQMVVRLAENGLQCAAAFEPEFSLFRKTSPGEYEPADTDGMFTVDGLDRHYDLLREVMQGCATMGVQVTQIAKEYGPAQYEGSTLHAGPMKAVDDYLTFKEVVRSAARRSGLLASFMPKPFMHLPGNGLHLHLSLWDAEGKKDLGSGERETEPLSETGLHFVGGLLKHSAALCAAGSPIVNSYKRLLPGSWSPAHVCWGVGNRAALVRIPGMGARRHLEFRSGDNAANPYIFMTALLSAGLDGILHKVAPPDPVSEDVGHLTGAEAQARGLEFLPRTLEESLAGFEKDTIIRDALGDTIHAEFLKVKRSELEAYAVQVHPWERHLYLEAI